MARFRRLRRLSSWRKLSLLAWDAPRDPTIYGAIEIDAQNALDYVKQQSDAASVKVTLTHLVGKALAEAIAARPDVNALIRRGRYVYERDSIDIFFQIAIDGGENLSGVKVEAADKKSVVEIACELHEQVERVRTHEDPKVTRLSRRMALLPGRLRSATFAAGQYLTYDLGMNLSLLGIPYDPFGSAMVTNVGTFGIAQGFAPLVSFARIPIVITMGAVEPRPRVVGDEVKVRPVMHVGAALDHRLLDGYQTGRIAARFREVLEHPATAL